jgi:hypothetical protein
MWGPRRLTTLKASTACNGDSFTFFFLYLYISFSRVSKNIALFPFSFSCSVRIYCDSERIAIEILTDLLIFNRLNRKKKCFFKQPVYTYVRMRPSVAPERLNGFCSRSVFESLFIMGRRPLNISILAPEIEAPSNGSQNTKEQFLFRRRV